MTTQVRPTCCEACCITPGCPGCDSLREENEELRPDPTARMSVAFLLTRIGSWTNARWDQHLRHEIGDAAANDAIEWIERTFRVSEFGNQPASEPWASLLPGEESKG